MPSSQTDTRIPLVFERATVRRMGGHLRRVLEQLAAAGGMERKVSELAILTQEEEEELREWNETGEEYERGKGIHEMVRKRCDAILRIPMAGKISSLNVSVAAGIVLFDWKRRRPISA